MANGKITQALPYFTDNDIKRCLNYDTLIPLMSEVLADHSRPNDEVTVQPGRLTTTIDANQNSFCMILTGVCARANALVAKVMTRYPNRCPTSHKLLLSFDLETGKPFAIMDGEQLTAMRTAAITAVATQWLAPDESKTLAIIGAGVQGTAHVQALRCIREFDEVRVWSRDFQNAKQFAITHGCVPCETVKEAVVDADVIVTATSSKTPVLEARWVKKGAHINCIGAVFKDWQELDPELMTISDVYVNMRNKAMKSSGDIILSGADIRCEIGELILGTKTADRNTTTVFKSMGMVVADAVCSKLVIDEFAQDPKL